MAIKRDPEGRKAQILAAATREFAASGYGGGRVDAIAAAAGVNKRLLYHYFGDTKNETNTQASQSRIQARSGRLGGGAWL